MPHLRPINTLAQIEPGVAALENSIYESTQAGGAPPSDHDMKNDLLRLLPEEIQLDFMWGASEDTMGFVQFRDLVAKGSARILIIQKLQRGIHQLAEGPTAVPAKLPAGMGPEDLAMFEGVTNAENW